MNFDEYLCYWFNTLVNSGEHKPSSLDRIESTCNTHIIPAIGKYKLKEIKTAYIENEVISMMNNKKLSYSSIKKAYDTLNSCFRFAINNCHLQNNPMANVKKPRQVNYKKKTVVSYTDEEIMLLKEKCLEKNSNGKPKYSMGAIFIFLLNTGLRLGEVLDLRWNDVDMENNNVIVNSNCTTAIDRTTGSKKRVKQSVSPKSKAGYRVIPLNESAIMALEVLGSIRYFGDESFVIANKNGNQNTESNIRRMFNEICKSAGVAPKGIHALRHTFATKLFENNVDCKTVSTLLGHSSISTTLDIYVDASKSMQVNAVKITNI